VTTLAIIGAVAGVVVILAFGAVRLARRGGQERGELQAERDQARASAAASKAVAEVLAQPTSREDVIRDAEEGKF